MKNFLLILVLAISFFSCKSKIEIKPLESKSTIKEKVNKVLDGWHLAASEANYQDYFGKMDSVSVFIGTDATENWTKTEFESFSKPYFDKGKAWSFTALERNVYVNNDRNFVWFDELLDTWMGTCRGSGVLENKNGNWLIKHYVLSVEIPNDDVQAVILAKKKNDSIFLSRYKK
ncbi:nuclear transport factor 2 family protein [Polaribacter sp. Z022]|uniref:nuclear transport factor 2 family protein n=1 Tax=Polaribacter sp. Z022 TaxID=2927125 RepID=UPI0020208CED|nr:nuclear transport factor 2 family protein [Polaribacter sp. Z022]MCL7754565.1 nuclear transport factor 2 family protein [Polaribacter sp. Z022]